MVSCIVYRTIRTCDGTAVADNGGDSSLVSGETLGVLEVRRVQVLRAVREEVEALGSR